LDCPQKWKELKKKIISYTQAPVVKMNRVFSLSLPKGISKVGVFCGIAKPQAFEKAVADLGYTIVDTIFSPDHVLPKLQILKEFSLRCKDIGAQALICTEKDLVKIPKDLLLDLPVVPLVMGLDIIEGYDAWHNCLEKIRIKGCAFF
jgi:tetraacyldisaccharide-1-P 4'-kinase